MELSRLIDQVESADSRRERLQHCHNFLVEAGFYNSESSDTDDDADAHPSEPSNSDDQDHINNITISPTTEEQTDTLNLYDQIDIHVLENRDLARGLKLRRVFATSTLGKADASTASINTAAAMSPTVNDNDIRFTMPLYPEHVAILEEMRQSGNLHLNDHNEAKLVEMLARDSGIEFPDETVLQDKNTKMNTIPTYTGTLNAEMQAIIDSILDNLESQQGVQPTGKDDETKTASTPSSLSAKTLREMADDKEITTPSDLKKLEYAHLHQKKPCWNYLSASRTHPS